MIGGFYITISQPFSVGDYIKITEYEGEVSKIRLKAVTIKSEAFGDIVIPNSLFLTYPVTNILRMQKEQSISIDFEFGFEYDPEFVIKIIYEGALSSPYIYSKLKPKVLLQKSDFILKKRYYQAHLYIIDLKFTDNLIHSLNMIVDNAINKKNQ